MPRLLLNTLSLLLLIALSAPLYAVQWWPFGPKAQETSIKVTLEDYSGDVSTTSTGILGLDVIYEFGADEDRAYLSSSLYPQLEGIEIFKGRIRSLALKESDFERAVKRLTPEIKSRVEIYPSYLEKRKYATFRTNGKTFALQTQSFFMTDTKTFVLEYSSKEGLLVLELNKVYERPAEIEVFRPLVTETISKENPNSHPLYQRQHFAVTVRHDRPGYIPHISADWHQNASNSLNATAERAASYYEPFNKHLIKHRQYTVLDAVQALVGRQHEEKLNSADLANLEVIDEYLFKLKAVPKSFRIETTESTASRPRDALDMRLLLFGAEPHETWLFQFEPQLQNPEKDFYAFENDQSLWLSYSPEPDSKAAFLHTNRGLLLTQAYTQKTYLKTLSNHQARIDFLIPGVGYANSDRTSYVVSTSIKEFEAEIQRQVSRGLQGNSDYSQHLLYKLIACRDLLSPPADE